MTGWMRFGGAAFMESSIFWPKSLNRKPLNPKHFPVKGLRDNEAQILKP